MPKQSIKVSVATFHEIVAAMDKTGIKYDKEKDSITLTPDLALEQPLDWRIITVRKDAVTEATKVYKTPMVKEFEVSDSSHFVNFVDDVFKYILEGIKPTTQLTPTETKAKPPQQPKKPAVESGWGTGH